MTAENILAAIVFIGCLTVSFHLGKWANLREIRRLPDLRRKLSSGDFVYSDLVETICPVCGCRHSSTFAMIIEFIKTGASCVKCKTVLTETIRTSPAGQAVLARQAKAAAHAAADAEIADAMKAAKAG